MKLSPKCLFLVLRSIFCIIKANGALKCPICFNNARCKFVVTPHKHLCNDKRKPTVSSGTSIFVLSADILNHFVVKDIKFFTCLDEFFAILSQPLKYK